MIIRFNQLTARPEVEAELTGSSRRHLGYSLLWDVSRIPGFKAGYRRSATFSSSDAYREIVS